MTVTRCRGEQHTCKYVFDLFMGSSMQANHKCLGIFFSMQTLTSIVCADTLQRWRISANTLRPCSLYTHKDKYSILSFNYISIDLGLS